MDEAEALRLPPRCLSAFNAAGILDPRVGVIFTEWTLACRHCRADRFALSELSTVGEDSWAVGIRARCMACGVEEQVFDSVSDGHDGEFGNNAFLEGDRTSAPLADRKSRPLPPGRVRASFTYNAALDELAEFGADANIAVRDLFDWFNLEVAADDGDWRRVCDCECA